LTLSGFATFRDLSGRFADSRGLSADSWLVRAVLDTILSPRAVTLSGEPANFEALWKCRSARFRDMCVIARDQFDMRYSDMKVRVSGCIAKNRSGSITVSPPTQLLERLVLPASSVSRRSMKRLSAPSSVRTRARR